MILKITELRKKLNLTQKQVADSIGVTVIAIQNYENQRRTPTIDILIKLADYFDVSLDYLVGRTDNPKTNK